MVRRLVQQRIAIKFGRKKICCMETFIYNLKNRNEENFKVFVFQFYISSDIIDKNATF